MRKVASGFRARGTALSKIIAAKDVITVKNITLSNMYPRWSRRILIITAPAPESPDAVEND